MLDYKMLLHGDSVTGFEIWNEQAVVLLKAQPSLRILSEVAVDLWFPAHEDRPS